MEKFGIKAKGQKAIVTNGSHSFKEPTFFKKPIFTFENSDLRPNNAYFWNDIPII